MFYLVIFTICLVGIGLLGLVIAGKFPLNGYPVIMLGPVFLFFVVNALQLHANKVAYNYIDEWMFTFACFVCLVSFLSVLMGWCYVDVKPKDLVLSKKSSVTYYPYDRLFTIGTVCHILSFIAEFMIASKQGGLIKLYSQGHAFYSGGNENPLLFYLFFLNFCGTVPYLQCFFCNKTLPMWQRIIIMVVCALQLFRTLIAGQRGWVFNLVFIYLTVPFFCIGRWPKVRQVAYFLLPALMFVIILPAIRGSVYLGSSDLGRLPELAVEALSEASQGDTGSGIADNYDTTRVSSEFILGAATISKAWEKNAYTYGLSFYDFLINPIPRALWPGKPLNIGLQTQKDIINNNFPWSFNAGSAPTGFADVFLNFGFFCIPFWFFFGLIHRWVYDVASKPGNFYAQEVYVCLLCGSTYLLNQNVLFWGTNIMASLVFVTLFYSYARVIKRPKILISSNSKTRRFH